MLELLIYVNGFSFVMSINLWVEVAKLTPSDGAADDRFGDILLLLEIKMMTIMARTVVLLMFLKRIKKQCLGESSQADCF